VSPSTTTPSRGETPLAWGGAGAASLGLFGAVEGPSYDALFGPGGATDPVTGERLVSAKRPGMELVIAAHKSVAELAATATTKWECQLQQGKTSEPRRRVLRARRRGA
jgi:hypothetical protein